MPLYEVFLYFWYVWNRLPTFSVPCLLLWRNCQVAWEYFFSRDELQGIECTQCFFWLLSQKEARYQENYIEVSPRIHVIWGNVLLDAQITISLHSGIQKVTRLVYCKLNNSKKLKPVKWKTSVLFVLRFLLDWHWWNNIPFEMTRNYVLFYNKIKLKYLQKYNTLMGCVGYS